MTFSREQQIKDFILAKSDRINSNSNREIYFSLIKNLFILENIDSINWLILNLDKIKKYLISDENILYYLILNFLKRGSKLNLIIKYQNNIINFINDLKKLDQEYLNFKLKILNENIDYENGQEILTWKNSDKTVGYRFSPEASKMTSIICANDPIFSEKCNKLFESLLKNDKYMLY